MSLGSGFFSLVGVRGSDFGPLGCEEKFGFISRASAQETAAAERASELPFPLLASRTTSATPPTAAEIIAETSVIEDAGFTIWDDVTHGYGGGYLAPVLGCTSRPAGPVPDFTFAENMMLVVQPNIITTDAKAGVQTGGLVRITKDGNEHMQIYPSGIIRSCLPTSVPGTEIDRARARRSPSASS